MARYISCTETAKLVRKALKENFPGITFSVKQSSGGGSIHVRWTDGPTRPAVESVAKHFQGATFDGMIDLKSYVTGTLDGEEVHFGADWVICTRSMSRAFVTPIIAAFCKRWGSNPQDVKVAGTEQEVWIDGYGLPHGQDHWLSQLLEETDGKDMHRPYEAEDERKHAQEEEWLRGEPARQAEAEEWARNEPQRRAEAEREAEEAYRRESEEILREQAERSRQRREREQTARVRRPVIASRAQALTYLGLPPDATANEVVRTFRAKAKAASDGRGGYVAGTDMDLLVQAKEKALASSESPSSILETLRNAY